MHALIGFPPIVRLVVVHPALHLKASGRAAVEKCSHMQRPLHRRSTPRQVTDAIWDRRRQAYLICIKENW